MLDPAPPQTAPSNVEVVADFTDYLRVLRYRPCVIGAYAHAVEHFTSWLSDERMEITQLQEALVVRFVEAHLPNCHCSGRPQRTKTTRRSALRHLLKALRLKGAIAPPAPQISPPIRADLDAFSDCMRQVCGLADNTVISRRQWVARFLQHHFSATPVDIAALTPGDFIGFVTAQYAGFQPGSVRVVGTALRSYLRFRSVHWGDAVERLLAAVPTVAQWPQATIPKHLSSEEVELWLRAFDRRTSNGKRDCAMARCLAGVYSKADGGTGKQLILAAFGRRRVYYPTWVLRNVSKPSSSARLCWGRVCFERTVATRFGPFSPWGG